jgi:hypothetical protein
LTTTVSTGVGGRVVYSWAPETADPGAAYHVYIKPGTSPETNPAAIATPDALVSGVANPGTYSGTAGGQYNIVVSASRGTETVYSNPMFVETGDYAGNTPVASVLTFTTGTSDGEISYSWTAGQYIAAHKLYVAIGNYTAAADVIANGWVVRTATEAEEAIGVTAVVKGNPGLVYSAVVAALDGATPVYSNVASGVAAKGTLSAATNIARLYQTVTATSTWHDAGYEAVKAVDGSLSSRWSADTGAVNTADTAAAPTADLTLTFGLPVQVDAAGLIDYNHTLKMFSVQYLAADGTWQNAYVHDGGAARIPWGDTTANENQLFAMDFTTGMIQSTQIRLRLQRASASSPSIWEFRLFREGYGVNIAPLAAVSASSVHSADYAAAKAVDNDAGSRWAVKDADWAIGAPVECWLEFDYGGETKTVSAAAMRSFGARIGSFKIQYYSGGAWQDAHTYPGPAAVNGATTGGSPKVKWDFSPVSAAKFRLLITSNTPVAANAPSLWEFYLYSTP